MTSKCSECERTFSSKDGGFTCRVCKRVFCPDCEAAQLEFITDEGVECESCGRVGGARDRRRREEAEWEERCYQAQVAAAREEPKLGTCVRCGKELPAIGTLESGRIRLILDLSEVKLVCSECAEKETKE